MIVTTKKNEWSYVFVFAAYLAQPKGGMFRRGERVDRASGANILFKK